MREISALGWRLSLNPRQNRQVTRPAVFPQVIKLTKLIENLGYRMRKVIWATPLYKFLRYCNDSPLDKTVRDCGAGGSDPPLQLFYEYGYKTFGVEVSENPFKQAKNSARNIAWNSTY